jgi:hypothetical protein
MIISRHEKIMCGWCAGVSTLGEWNDLTFSKCTNREMKRAFTQLTESKAFLHKSDTFYICPKCNKWSRGSQLKIVDTDNKMLLKLGGEKTISTLDK